MVTMQEQARALGDPTRHSVFRFIVDAGEPVDVAALTEHHGLNHNAIRQHLAKLVAAGLVQEGRAAPTGPGRPRLVYTVDPGAESRWGVTGPYERLSVLLAEIIRSGDTPVEVGRREGLRLRLGPTDPDPTDPDPTDPDPTDPDAAMEAVCEAMAREGFEPEVEARPGGAAVVLRRCPFETTALADPETVCQIHLGIAQGVAEATGALGVTGLLARDPRRAGCRLEVEELAPEA